MFYQIASRGIAVHQDPPTRSWRVSKKHELDVLSAIGGDGSLTIANSLHERGFRVGGVRKTIDNDLESTALTFGYQTAASFATECIDRLHSTAESHRRIMVIEVIGRYAGWIALNGESCVCRPATSPHAMFCQGYKWSSVAPSRRCLRRDLSGR
jgi:6-phosphofructokinase